MLDRVNVFGDVEEIDVDIMTKNILLTEIMENDVNNPEIRYRFLKAHYDRFYAGKTEQHANTDEIIKEAGLDNEDKGALIGNIQYLVDGFYVEGIKPLGATYHTSLKLQPRGIEFVEEHNQELREIHDNLRFRILSELYELFFGEEGAGRPVFTKPFVEQIAKSEEEHNLLFGETVYLGDAGYVHPDYTSRPFPYTIKMENSGIDLVENIIDNSVSELETSEIDAEAKAKVSEIKLEPNKKSKIQKLKDLYDECNGDARPIIVEVIKQVIIRAFSGEFGGELPGGA